MLLRVRVVPNSRKAQIEELGHSPGEAEGNQSSDAAYKLGDTIDGFPERELSVTIMGFEWSGISEEKDRLRVVFSMKYEGKAKSELAGSTYFDNARDCLLIRNGQYEFPAKASSIAGLPRSLLPGERVEGRVDFEVPFWFLPRYLVASENGKKAWTLQLDEDPDHPFQHVGRHASIIMSGPITAQLGDTITLCVSNTGNVDLTSWGVGDEYGDLNEMGDSLKVGEQRSISTGLQEIPPWIFRAWAEGLGGREGCLDTFVVGSPVGVAVLGPGAALPGTTVTISVENMGDIDLVDYVMTGAIDESGTDLRVGCSREYGVTLKGAGPWQIGVEAQTAGGVRCSDTLTIGGYNPSITVMGPSTANTGDTIVLSIKNSGNVDLTRWTISGDYSATGGTFTPGSQRSFSTTLTGQGPWTFSITAFTQDGRQCQDFMIVKGT